MFHVLLLIVALPFADLKDILHFEPNPPITGTRRVTISFDLSMDGAPPYWSISRGDSLIGSFRSFKEEISFTPPLHAGEDLRIYARYRISGKTREGMVRVEVANAPPVYKGARIQTQGDTLLLRLNVEDPENDSLRIKLLSPDPSLYQTNHLTLKGPIPEAETTEFEVEITDSINTLRVTIPVILQKR